VSEHPELRLETVDLADLPQRNRSRCPANPGSYEWWRFEAVDPGARTGCVLTFHNGLAFSPQYRRQVARHYDGTGAGRPELIWPEAHPAVSIAVFQNGKSLRRSDLLYKPGALSESTDPWTVRIGPSSIRQEGAGWRLSLRGTPWSLGLAGPQLHPDEEIRIELEFQPQLQSPTLERAYLPEQRRVRWPARRDVSDETASVIAALERGADSSEPAIVLSSVRAAAAEPGDADEQPVAGAADAEPDEEGSADLDATPIERPTAQHRWLLACPSARVTGTITVTTKKGKQTIQLENAIGYHDHVWGSGPIGEGFHSRFATRVSWPDGAVVCDLPMYGRYVQVAATFMLFHKTRPPSVYRGDRVQLASPQLSAWMLPLPGEMRWREVKDAVSVHQEATATVESLAHGSRGLATVDVTYPAEEDADAAASARKGMRTVRGLGITELDQYNRMDMPVISRLIERSLFTNPEPSEGRD
jgi:hypothetical protein